MTLEEKFNKNISEITINDINSLGEEMALVSDEEMKKWCVLHKDKNTYMYYKEICTKLKARKICKEIFVVGEKITEEEIQKLFQSSYYKNLLIKNLVKNEYLIYFKSGIYIVDKTDEYGLVDYVANAMWLEKYDKIRFAYDKLEGLTGYLARDIYHENESFWNDVKNIFKDYNFDLIDQDENARREFIESHIKNSSRGYILRLLAIKYLYSDFIDAIDYYVDDGFCFDKDILLDFNTKNKK